MNIFRLHDDPVTCAEWHCNSHCIKMILEYSQLLSTAHQVAGSTLDPLAIYKQTHTNHPSAVWVRESKANYRWLHSLLTAVCAEYTYRYGKIHKVQREGLLDSLKLVPNIPDTEETPLRLAMPDEFRTSSATESYRRFYVFGKAHLHQWKNRPVPPFVKTLNSYSKPTTTSNKEIQMTASMLVPGSVWERKTKKGVTYSTVMAVSNEGLPEDILEKFPQQVVYITEKWSVLTQPIEVFLKGRTFFTLDSEFQALVNQLTTEPVEAEDDDEIVIDEVEIDESLFAGLHEGEEATAEAGTVVYTPETVLASGQQAAASTSDATLNVGPHALAQALEANFAGYSEAPFHTGDTLHTLRFTLAADLSVEDIRKAFWLKDPNAIQNVLITSAYEVTKLQIDSFLSVGIEVANGAPVALLHVTSAGDFRGELETVEIVVTEPVQAEPQAAPQVVQQVAPVVQTLEVM